MTKLLTAPKMTKALDELTISPINRKLESNSDNNQDTINSYDQQPLTAPDMKKALDELPFPISPIKRKLESNSDNNNQETINSYNQQLPCTYMDVVRESSTVCEKRLNPRPKTTVKRVRFHPSTKTHDGTSHHQANLERVITDFCSTNPNITIIMQLLNERNHKDLQMLLINLRDLVLRVARNPKGRAPLLKKGGGRGITIKRKNLRHVQKLFKATALAYKECTRLIAASI